LGQAADAAVHGRKPQRPPRVLLGRSTLGRLLLNPVGIRFMGGILARTIMRRFAFGVTRVQLKV
jgi:hypothetical protein